MSSTQFHSPIFQIFDEAFNQGNLDIVDERRGRFRFVIISVR